MNDTKYSEYENMYPETVVIRKEGYFFMVRGLGALICHNIFRYKCWKSSDEVVSMGFGATSLSAVCEKLSEESISYLVLVRGEIVSGESFADKNRFSEFINVDTSDIPYRAKSKKDKTEIDILTEEERKLCDISIKYMERLLGGHHPVNNSEISTDTVLMDENVQRCFSFVVDVLKRVNNEDEMDETLSKRKLTSLTFKPDFEEVIDKMIQDREMKMTEIEAFINPYLGELFVEKVEKVSASRISNWLLDNGYLVSVTDEKGERHREASEDGKIIGMTNTFVNYDGNNSYVQYKFTPKAQRFLFENLAEIAVYKRKRG